VGTRHVVVRHALYSAVNSIAVQGIAIISLSAGHYGLFSIYFLIFAFASSLVLSVIAEPWVRVQRTVRSPWETYCTMLCIVAASTLIPTAFLGLATGSLLCALMLSISVALATFRVGARYFATVNNTFRYVGPADVASTAAMIGGFFLARACGISDLEAVSIAWCLSNVAATCFSRPIRGTLTSGPRRWYNSHKLSIRPLLMDSFLLDVGVIGVPLMISPILGIASFGVYRSVSSAALPVRLVLSPLRPFLERRPLQFFLSGRVFAAVTSTGVLIGSSILAGLLLVDAKGWFSEGVVGELAHFALPVGLFVMFNCTGNFYYLVSRTHSHGSRLLLFRFVSLGSAIVLPITGVLMYGLEGAVWAFAIDTIVLCFFIIELLRRERNTQRL
jgi:hypothetical protein